VLLKNEEQMKKKIKNYEIKQKQLTEIKQKKEIEKKERD